MSNVNFFTFTRLNLSLFEKYISILFFCEICGTEKFGNICSVLTHNKLFLTELISSKIKTKNFF